MIHSNETPLTVTFDDEQEVKLLHLAISHWAAIAASIEDAQLAVTLSYDLESCIKRQERKAVYA